MSRTASAQPLPSGFIWLVIALNVICVGLAAFDDRLDGVLVGAGVIVAFLMAGLPGVHGRLGKVVSVAFMMVGLALLIARRLA